MPQVAGPLHDCPKLAIPRRSASLDRVKRIPPLAWVSTAAALAALAVPLAATAFDPFLVSPEASIVDQSPAYRHANMTPDAALAELQSRGVLLQREGSARGVQTPIRLTGRLHGVHVHTALPDAQRVTSPFEVCDARFALALDDFTAILAKHDIDEVIHYSMYRPGSPPAPVRRAMPPGALPSGQPLPPLPAPDVDAEGRAIAPEPVAHAAPSGSASAQEPAPRAVVPSRHPAGLAIDVAKLHKRGGDWLDVSAHFAGHIGARTCGAEVAAPADDKARELRAVVCECLDAKVFTYVLTPNYNLAHRDHFHMEIKAGARWFLYH